MRDLLFMWIAATIMLVPGCGGTKKLPSYDGTPESLSQILTALTPMGRQGDVIPRYSCREAMFALNRHADVERLFPVVPAKRAGRVGDYLWLKAVRHKADSGDPFILVVTCMVSLAGMIACLGLADYFVLSRWVKSPSIRGSILAFVFCVVQLFLFTTLGISDVK